jgi:PAS domain S-box-containing protein
MPKSVAVCLERLDVSRVLGKELQNAGFSVRLISSMAELRNNGEDAYPAVVVADLSRCMDTPDTVWKSSAGQESYNSRPRLVVLADQDGMEDRLHAVRYGATRFIKKPIDTKQLVAELDCLLEIVSGEKLRVLFVDDERAMTTLYAVAMEQAGLSVRTVNDPLLALREIVDFAPDVVVTDIHMPGCSGLELAALLRQDVTLAAMPILFLSGESDPDQRLAAFELGADDFLFKPVDLNVLATAVILRARRAREQKARHHEYREMVAHVTSVEATINAHCLVSIADPKGRITYANKHFCETSGYRSDELIGQTHRIVKSDQHPPGFYQQLWETIHGGRTWQGEICNRHRDGHHYWVEATITPQVDAHGIPVRYVTVRTEITRLKELQTMVGKQLAEVVQAKHAAEAANIAKSEFLTNMSHELRTPMHGILSFSNLGLTKKNPTPEKIAEYFTYIKSSADRLMRLINALLDLSKLEAGKMEMCFAPGDLAQAAQSVINEMAALAVETELDVRLDVAATSTALIMDSGRIIQAIRNLLANAFRFSPAQGIVQLRIADAMLASGPALLLSVADQGQGIPADELDVVFEKFIQSTLTKTGAGGTGLGLTICREIVALHNGTLHAHNRPEGGAEFMLYLPVQQVTEPTPELLSSMAS